MNLDLRPRTNESVPALSLPTEIVCVIFKMTSRSPPPFNPVALPRDIRNMRMEINVSQVCRLWRSMALTYPELWSTFAHDDLWSSSIPLDCLLAYLQRSGNCLVDLYFRLGDNKREDWVATMDLIVLHVSRWRRLSLRIDRPWPADYLFASIEYLLAPNLEMLEVCTPHFPEDTLPFGYREFSRPFFRNGVPKLTSLRLDSTSFIRCKPRNFDTLTAVTVHIHDNFAMQSLKRTPWSTFASLISSPNLMHLSIVGQVFDIPNVSELIKYAISPRLANFRCSDETIICFMWQLVRAPRLKLLIIKDFLVDDLYSPNQFDEAGILSSLSTLVLLDCSPVVFQNTILVHATRYVKRLTIVKSRDLDTTVMDNLLAETEGTMIWPGLESIIYIRLDRSRVLNKKCKLGLTAAHANK
ncbi:hypothetical protein BJ912DRAFT_1005322 [Pholiota molesta]|nr:hypothetical protein BJ912DRAFT_1005322 [Pholiota molesta]